MRVSRIVKDDFHTGRKPDARENRAGHSASFRLRLAALIGGVGLIAPLAVLGGIAPAAAAPGDYEVTDSVEVGYSPFGVAVDSSTNTVYVVNTGNSTDPENPDGSLTVINGANNAVIATVELPGYATGIAVDEETHAVYVGDLAAEAVSVIDPTLDYAVVATIPVGDPAVEDSPVAIAVDSNTHTVYVANFRGDSVSVIDYSGSVSTIEPAAYAMVANVAVGNGPQDIAVNSNTHMVYTADCNDDTVTVLNGANNSVVGTLDTGEFPTAVAVDDVSNTVYANALNNESTMTVFDGEENTVITTLDLSDRAYDLAADASNQTFYAALEDGNLAVFDGATNTQTAAVDIGKQLQGVAVNSSTHATYVTTLNSQVAPGTLWAINGAYPATAPAAPTIGTATAGNAEATVTFTAPTDDGGSAITEYTVTATDVTTPGNGGQTVTGAAGPITVPGLTNGDTYTFTVSATNSVGIGPESAPSNQVTPMAPTAVPGAPTIGVATAGDSEATVTFTPPTDDGGSAITEYTVTATDVTTPANGGQTVTGAAGPITVPGLTNGDTYTFTVSATNAVGTGPESAPSNEVTPATTPGAPVIGTATAGDGQATVTFTPPTDDGGAAITEYTVTATDATTPGDGGQTVTGTTSPITVTGLTNGVTYTFTVSARNRVGTGPESAASNAVTPLAPSVPVVPAPPVTPVSPVDPGLASTGPDLTVPLGLVGLLLAAGVALLVVTSRGRSREQFTR